MIGMVNRYTGIGVRDGVRLDDGLTKERGGHWT